MAHRQNASENGGISPRTARPTTMLPDQNRVVSVNSRYGWLKRASMAGRSRQRKSRHYALRATG